MKTQHLQTLAASKARRAYKKPSLKSFGNFKTFTRSNKGSVDVDTGGGLKP